MHLRFQHLVGIFFFGYAFTTLWRPSPGLLAYIYMLYFLPPPVIVSLYLACGGILILVPVRPPLVVLLSLPLALVSLAGALRAFNDDGLNGSLALTQAFVCILILDWAWHRSREGTDD